jgi:hypothetical protein
MTVPLKIGIHQSNMSYGDPSMISPDLMARQVYSFDPTRVSDTLATQHVAGDGVLTITNPAVFADDPGYSGAAFYDLIQVRDSGTTNGGVSRGVFTFNSVTYLGSTRLFITSIASGVDVTCDAGSLVNNTYSGNYSSTATGAAGQLPLPAPYVKAGRDTGYPTGLLAGQSIRVIYAPSRATPAGTWTVRAKGTGTLLVQTGGGNFTFSFVGGVCSTPTFTYAGGPGPVWLINLTASSPALPLHDVRVICPGTMPGGESFVSLYDANANDPAYFLHHPGYVDFHKPFACIRTVDNNTNQAAVPPTIAEWAERTPMLQRIGCNVPRSMPVEQEVQLANDCGTDLWHGLGFFNTDAYVREFGAYVRDHLDPRLKVHVEWVLENWNWSYVTKRASIGRWEFEVSGLTSLTLSGTTATAVAGHVRVPTALSASGGVATATLASHGLKVGSKIRVAGAAQPEYNVTATVASATTNAFTYAIAGTPAAATGQVAVYGHGLLAGDGVLLTGAAVAGYNGQFTVATAPAYDTFTFTAPAGLASPAVPLQGHKILAYPADAKVMAIDAGSLQFTMTAGGYRGTFTTPAPGMFSSDYLILSGCADPRADGMWWVYSVVGTTVTIAAVPATLRPLPTDAVGSVAIAAGDAGPIRFRKVVSNAGAAGYPTSEYWAARWSGRRHQQVHAILRPLLGSRLVPVIGGWTGDGPYTQTMMAQYKADCGGAMVGDEVLAIGAYFKADSAGGADFGEWCVNGMQRAISSLTSSAGLATVTSFNHGFATGDTARIFGVTQPDYNGTFVVEVLNASTFTYAVPNAPSSPATATRDGMKCGTILKAGAAVVSIVRKGQVATVTTAAPHGLGNSTPVRIAGATQPEYNGDFGVASFTATTFTINVAGSPATPATGTITAGFSGAFSGRELITLTASAGVATAYCPSHGMTTGQTWHLGGVDDVASGGAVTGSYRGAKSITVTDADHFTFPVTGSPTTPAVASLGVRPWMYPASAMAGGFAAMNAHISGPGAGSFPQILAGFVASYVNPTFGVSGLVCYESGQHLASTSGQCAAAWYHELNRDPRMGTAYRDLYATLAASGVIPLAIHYKGIGGTGAGNEFGTADFVGQSPPSVRLATLLDLVTTTYPSPDHSGAIGAVTMRIQASLNLGKGMAGLLANLRAQPQSADGAGTDIDVGSPLSSGFTDKGNGFYRWDYSGLDATLVGGVKFFLSTDPTTTIGYGLVDPRQAVTTSAYVDPAAALTNVGLTPTRALKLDNLDVASSTLATPALVSTSVGAGLTAAGFTSARALKLDNLDVASSTLATPALVSTSVGAGLTAAGFTSARALKLDNLDVPIGARFTSLDTNVAAATAASSAVNIKFDPTRLSKLDNLLANGIYSTFAGGTVASVTAPVSVAGNVNIGGYATGQDPASLLLTTPANKLATDGNGRVSAGTVLDKAGYSVAGGVTVAGYASGQDPATLVLSTPQNRLKTDTTGRVILAAVSHDGAIVPTVGDVTNKSGFALSSAGLDTVSIEPGINIRQAISPILAASAGTLSGAGTGTVVIKGGNNAPTRITASTDNAGNRSSVTLTLPA